MEIAATSTEYIHIPVAARAAGTPITIATPPQLAFLLTDANPGPGDWLAGEWHDGDARILVGPTGGAITLEQATYRVWIKVAAGVEIPVQLAGRITVY
ncbi:hypothetical protein ACH4GK_31810 [Streptomyces rimosus]|uniref:hypothetical protein n=1 Tax=Streptomyces rimosus TaxID=1927 RepID=UPI0004C5A4E8|nr:hypothetical protein [Streptomyces rimosus]